MCECEAEEANENGHVMESGVNELKHFAVGVLLLLCNSCMWSMHGGYTYISRQEL